MYYHIYMNNFVSAKKASEQLGFSIDHLRRMAKNDKTDDETGQTEDTEKICQTDAHAFALDIQGFIEAKSTRV